MVELVSDCGSIFRIADEHYKMALWLGQDYGWEPAGVEHPEEDFAPLNYLSPHGQKVNMIDAISLSVAICRALDDIPNEDQQNNRDDGELNILEYWSGPHFKEYLRQFAGFCRAAGFQVCA